MNVRNGLAYRLLALVVLATSWAVAAEEPPVLKALVVFGKFKGELPGVDAPPAWAEDIFDPERPGSVSHFYDEMSFGQHRVRGEIAPRWYAAEQTAEYYAADNRLEKGKFSELALDILQKADRDIDFARFDNDGPDGIPNSGDDNGIADIVFLVMASIPRNVLIGAATGISHLGFAAIYETGDWGAKGRPIRVHPDRGTLQQGRTFAETVGIMCHEYGHVLGLTDLYDVDFIAQAEPRSPEDDSAGIGKWGLMGWGTLGWRGEGPNSLSAVSRWRLNWVDVEEPSQSSQMIRLEAISAGGKVFKIPLGAKEFFLLEYRQKGGSYYDRYIPAEGLLIWHVIWHGSGPSKPYEADLECADGRWQGRGYPAGEVADPLAGGDNLDFWAHDQDYARAHGGNLGDATDPFDGVRFRAFTPETNPNSDSQYGDSGVYLEDIQIADGMLSAQLTIPPLNIVVESVEWVDADRDGVFLAGEPVECVFALTNIGLIGSDSLHVSLRSTDGSVIIEQQTTSYPALRADKTTWGPGSRGYPRFSFDPEIADGHTAEFVLEVGMGGEIVRRHALRATGSSPKVEIEQVAVIDTIGNGDGRVQRGEFVRLELTLAPKRPEFFALATFSLRSVDEWVMLVGKPEVEFSPQSVPVTSKHNPEFLVRGDVAAGSSLEFEFATSTAYGTWEDTLVVRVSEGDDATPPRIGYPYFTISRDLLRVAVPTSELLDGSAIDSAWVVVRDAKNEVPITELPLRWDDELWTGDWTGAAGQKLRLQLVAVDQHGNQGAGVLADAHIPPMASAVSVGPWQAVDLPAGDAFGVLDMHFAPNDPEVLYAARRDGIWRSSDGGVSWSATGMMDYQRPLSVDAHTPWRVYVEPNLVSTDGGMTWNELDIPGEAPSLVALEDVGRHGLIYANSGGKDAELLVSADGGISWRAVGMRGLSEMRVHPQVAGLIYGRRDSSLYYSDNGGSTWEKQRLPRHFRRILPDPWEPDGLYATSGDTLWYSADRDGRWQPLAPQSSERWPFIKIAPSRRRQGLVFAWEGSGLPSELWRSEDSGRHWSVMSSVSYARVDTLIPNPHDADHLYIIDRFFRRSATLWETRDTGETWQTVRIPNASTFIGVIRSDGAGNFFAGSEKWLKAREDADLVDWSPALLASRNAGGAWEWITRIGFFKSSWSNYRNDSIEALAVNSAHIIAHTGQGYVRSDDGGQTWERFDPPGDRGSAGSYAVIAVDPHDPSVWWRILRGVWRSTDGGTTWEERGPIGGLYDGRGRSTVRWFTGEEAGARGLILDPSREGHVAVAAGGTVWNSTDAGQTWRPLTVLKTEGLMVEALAVHPEFFPRWYAATQAGVYVSNDAGRSWLKTLVLSEGPEYSDNRSFLQGRRLRIRFAPQDPNRVFVTDGLKLFESRDGGQRWRDIGQSLEGYPWFNDVAIHPATPEWVYAATPRGLFRLRSEGIDTAVQGAVAALPAASALLPNYPNPFNSRTILCYRLTHAGAAELVVYDLLGQRVRTIAKGVQPAGEYQIPWDGRDEEGRLVGSGVYLLRLKAGDEVHTGKSVLIR
ncbi:MAG: M6 family metalloprotease domain-containing protein [Gemmatimonadetes bacterium]|nr:M6 family metalloprotease domain-containing protein [Gemmatimonadota bacterium]